MRRWRLEPFRDASAQTKLDAAAAEKGSIVYVRYCVSCHGPVARGDGPLAQDLRVPVPDMTTLAARNGGRFPEARVARIIQSGEVLRGHGSADMPGLGRRVQAHQGDGRRDTAGGDPQPDALPVVAPAGDGDEK